MSVIAPLHPLACCSCLLARLCLLALLLELVPHYLCMFSGCMDCQYSADVIEASHLGAGGACTNAFLETLASGIIADGIVTPAMIWMPVELTPYSRYRRTTLFDEKRIGLTNSQQLNDWFWMVWL